MIIMSTADFLVKFNALDDDAQEVIIKMVDLLYPVSRKTTRKHDEKVEQNQQSINESFERSAEIMALEYATDKELTAFSVLDGEPIYEYGKE